VTATIAVAVAGYLTIVAGALALGVIVDNLVVGGAIGRGDLEIARWFAERRTDLRDHLSLVGSSLAETGTVVVIVAIVLIVLARRRQWPSFGLVALSLALEPMVYLVVTYLIGRDRPAVPRLEDLIVSDSFPSGHTAAAVALYSSLAIVVCAQTHRRVWRTLVLMLAVVAPILVGVARVYRGMHNPTDVLSGAAIGAACVGVAYLAVQTGVTVARQRQESERPADDAMSPHPPRPAGVLRGAAAITSEVAQ
jgi:undecaprenyl-diphosphatase